MIATCDKSTCLLFLQTVTHQDSIQFPENTEMSMDEKVSKTGRKTFGKSEMPSQVVWLGDATATSPSFLLPLEQQKKRHSKTLMVGQNQACAISQLHVGL